ncbi:MAG: tetratricopeptide repeat protein [Phycisphaerae bacterium]
MKETPARNSAKTLLFIAAVLLFSATELSGKTNLPNRKPVTATSLRAMARIYMAGGHYDKAEPMALQALNMARMTNASDSDLSMCLLDLAYLYNSQGRLKEAQQMCELGLKLQEKIYYSMHPYIAYTLRTLSDIYQGQGNYHQAKIVLDRAFTIMLDSHRPDDKAMTQFYMDRGKLLAATGDFRQADEYYQRAASSVTEVYGNNHLYGASLNVQRALIFISQRRYDRAEMLLNDAIQIQQKAYGSEHHLLIPTWLAMAKLNEAKLRYAQAEQLALNALEKAKDKSGPAHPHVAEALSILGTIYAANGRFAQAQTAHEQAVQILENTLGPNSDKTAEAVNYMARLYIEQGKYQQAQTLCDRALNTLENMFSREHPKVKEVLETITELQYRAQVVAQVVNLHN